MFRGLDNRIAETTSKKTTDPHGLPDGESGSQASHARVMLLGFWKTGNFAGQASGIEIRSSALLSRLIVNTACFTIALRQRLSLTEHGS